jgi:hypothetical protein
MTARVSVAPPGLAHFLGTDPGAADSLHSSLPLATLFRAFGAPRIYTPVSAFGAGRLVTCSSHNR